MASQAQPAAAAPQDQAQGQEPLVFVPNVRPEGFEVAGDRHWRDWRLRKRRPELRERYTVTFPNINPLLERDAKVRIDAQDNVNLVPFAKCTLNDLRNKSAYRVERLQFRPLQETHDKVDAIWAARHPRKARPQEELDKLPSFFFESLCSSLFARVWDFAAETFGQQPAVDARSDAQKQADFDRLLKDTDWTGHFLQHLPPDFIRCVSEVARGDYRNRGWKDYDPHGYEFLFLDRDQRIHVCTAVIAKLLQEQCFDSLLFGALKIERDALSKTDVAQEDIANGFARKMSRTSSVPKYLTRDLFTANFWQEVDRVTLGILDLLLPVINFVGELQPDVRVLPLTEVHQQLHKIVAEAGWLANGLALTRSCFWIDFPRPGQLWDVRQEHVTDVVWKASKAFTDKNDGADLDEALLSWRQARIHVYDALADDPKPALGEWSRSTYELDNPRPRQVRRTAKVQISMWPFFERSYPYRQELVSGDFNLGETTTVLQKAQVVYYAGNDANAGEQEEDYTLKQYLEGYRRRRAMFWGPRGWLSWPIIALLICSALYLAGPSIRAGYDEIRHSDWDLTDHLFPNWTKPTWEWPSAGQPRARRDEQHTTGPLFSRSSAHSDTEASHLPTLKRTSITSSQSNKSSPFSKSKPKPPIHTSDVYSTRTWTETKTKTKLRSSTTSLESREYEHHDDRKGSPTTVPASWTSTSQSSKQISKPLFEKPSSQRGQDISSITVLPDTVGAPEPTEEPSPVPTPSSPPEVSSTVEETSTDLPTPSKSAHSPSSFWRRIFHLGNTKDEAQKDSPEPPQEDNDLGNDPLPEVPKSEKNKTEIGKSDPTLPGSSVGVDSLPTGNVESLSSVFDESFSSALGEGKIGTSNPTLTDSNVIVDAVPTGNIESLSSVLEDSFSSVLDEDKKDSSRIHDTTSKQNWVQNWFGSLVEDEQPAPSFTTDLPPDAIFTDPARPEVTLNMEEGFWVMIQPLGFEYNCWIKSRTADCTSTVWTTVTAEPTAKPKVTEGPWKSSI